MEDPEPALPLVMVPVDDPAPEAEEDPADAVGAGKTVERTPEPGAGVLTDEGIGAVAGAVADATSALLDAVDEEAFAMAGSVEADVSAVSASTVVGGVASAAWFFA
ncbi:MAG: hypothetical protein ACKOAL_01230 [Chthoniobacterales bacterium]